MIANSACKMLNNNPPTPTAMKIIIAGSIRFVITRSSCSMEQELRVMTNLIEPAMIIFMAVGVGGLLFSILQALFAITQRMSV